MRVEGLAALTKTLRETDRATLNRLRSEMRGSINPVAREIAGAVGSEFPAGRPPLSGMGPNTRRGGNPVNGVTRWTGTPRTSVQFTPGRARGGASRILAMKFTGGSRAGGGIGFDYAELAGTSRRPGAAFSRVYERDGIPGFQHRINGQGRAFNEGIRKAKQINGRGGFFAYDAALKRYPQIEGLGKRAIDKFMADATRALERGGAI